MFAFVSPSFLSSDFLIGFCSGLVVLFVVDLLAGRLIVRGRIY